MYLDSAEETRNLEQQAKNLWRGTASKRFAGWTRDGSTEEIASWTSGCRTKVWMVWMALCRREVAIADIASKLFEWKRSAEWIELESA